MLSTMTDQLVDATTHARLAALGQRVLDGYRITREEASWLFELETTADIVDLLAWSNRIREKFKGNKIHLCSIVNAKAGDPVAAVKKGTGGGAHGVLITAPSLGAFKQGVGMTRKRGTCVLNGLPPGEFPTPLFDVVANCITIRGSFVGTREDMAEALAFAAEGKVKADIEVQPLSAINEILERLESGKVASRVVLEFTAS